MWVATKLGTRRPLRRPTDSMLLDQLGSPEDVRQYKVWARNFPEVERGPDQEIADHYRALRKAFDEGVGVAEDQESTEDPSERRRGLTIDKPRAVVQERTEPRDVPSAVRSTDELLADQTREQPPTDLKGMPRRIPGLNTGDSWAHSAPPEWVPRELGLPQRTPGTHYVDPALQAARPEPRRQTHDEWAQGLAEKGIYLNPDGSRMTPEQMQLPLRYPGPNGPRVWQQFVERSPETPAYAGRHRAAMVAYVLEKLAGPILHQKMLDNGWNFSGDQYNGNPTSGSYYWKPIGDRHHLLVKDDGWIHSSGPLSAGRDEFGDPIVDKVHQGFDDLGEAVLDAEKGVTHRPMVDRTNRTIEDSSFHPERMGPGASPTEPMEMKPGGPGTKGWFQTLSFTSWEEM